MWETRVQSMGQEDLLEKEMAIHSSMLAWKILWTEEPGRLQFMGLQRVRHDWVTSLSFFLVLLLTLENFLKEDANQQNNSMHTATFYVFIHSTNLMKLLFQVVSTDKLINEAKREKKHSPLPKSSEFCRGDTYTHILNCPQDAAIVSLSNSLLSPIYLP